MKYEIINPSDKCYISSNNELVARFCVLLLGNGTYGLHDENGKTVGHIYFFGVPEEVLDRDFEGDFGEFPLKHAQEIADCFNSFEYAYERTSINNIGERAKEFYQKFRDIVKE